MQRNVDRKALYNLTHNLMIKSWSEYVQNYFQTNEVSHMIEGYGVPKGPTHLLFAVCNITAFLPAKINFGWSNWWALHELVLNGRVPFDQKFRFEFSKFSYVEWNGVSPPGRTDLILFPLEHVSHQELLDKMLKDRDVAADLSAVSCFM